MSRRSHLAYEGVWSAPDRRQEEASKPPDSSIRASRRSAACTRSQRRSSAPSWLGAFTNGFGLFAAIDTNANHLAVSVKRRRRHSFTDVTARDGRRLREAIQTWNLQTEDTLSVATFSDQQATPLGRGAASALVPLQGDWNVNSSIGPFRRPLPGVGRSGSVAVQVRSALVIALRQLALQGLRAFWDCCLPCIKGLRNLDHRPRPRRVPDEPRPALVRSDASRSPRRPHPGRRAIAVGEVPACNAIW